MNEWRKLNKVNWNMRFSLCIFSRFSSVLFTTKKKVYVIYEFFLLPGPVQAFQPVQPESSVNI